MTSDVININPKILGGTPVFKGTRVPIDTLFDHLESGLTIDDFLGDFPSVTKEQAVMVLELTGKILTSKNFKNIDETTS